MSVILYTKVELDPKPQEPQEDWEHGDIIYF